MLCYSSVFYSVVFVFLCPGFRYFIREMALTDLFRQLFCTQSAFATISSRNMSPEYQVYWRERNKFRQA